MHSGLGETSKDVLAVDHEVDLSTKQILMEKQEPEPAVSSGFRRKQIRQPDPAKKAAPVIRPKKQVQNDDLDDLDDLMGGDTGNPMGFDNDEADFFGDNDQADDMYDVPKKKGKKDHDPLAFLERA